MNSREAFDAFYKPRKNKEFKPGVDGSMWEVWQAAIAHAREVAVMVCEEEKYAEPSDDYERDYNSGCRFCAAAIKEALK